MVHNARQEGRALTEEEKWNMLINPTPNPWSILGSETLEQGHAELVEFVRQTYRSLCIQESQQLKKVSTIQMFARIDVGVMEEGGNYSFFVNEVERNLIGTVLFLKHALPLAGGIVGDIVLALDEYVRKINPKQLQY